MEGEVDMIKTKIEKAMLGYIDRNQNVVAIEPSWNLGAPEDMGKFLLEKYPTKEDAIKVVDTAISIPKFRKDDYWYVDGYGEVICEHLAMDKKLVRKHIKHLYLWMRSEWHYSDNGIDWTPVREEIKAVA